MGSPSKALIPVTGVVLAAHAALLWSLPAADIPPQAKDDQLLMQTRMVEIAPPPPPPPAPEPAAPPKPRPQAVPKPKAPAPAPSAEPAAPEIEPNQPPAVDTQSPAAPEIEAPSAPVAAPEPEPAEISDGDTAKPMQITPAGSAPLPPGTPLPIALPGGATLEFNASGQVKGFNYSAGAELQWQHDGQYYQARQSISMFLLGERAQTSEGLITPSGLQPLNFTDKGRKTQSASFDLPAGKARFSDGTADAAIAEGVQDRLSVFLQLSALMAAGPERYPQGTVIDLTTSGARSAIRWRFRVGATEALELPIGSVMALRLDKLPGQSKSDQQGAIWLAPTMQYLPVRIRLTQGQDDFVDLKLKKYRPVTQ
ncbi:DUF3108 domain-containing protein [Comamonas aquatilis]|uniref:DUF3108 domain-containing protein n=1 Tax=Comamonas aquatilis TaxID=1778406 RepID=UPI0039F0631A